jgi:hypothetical protein
MKAAQGAGRIGVHLQTSTEHTIQKRDILLFTVFACQDLPDEIFFLGSYLESARLHAVEETVPFFQGTFLLVDLCCWVAGGALLLDDLGFAPSASQEYNRDDHECCYLQTTSFCIVITDPLCLSLF